MSENSEPKKIKAGAIMKENAEMKADIRLTIAAIKKMKDVFGIKDDDFVETENMLDAARPVLMKVVANINNSSISEELNEVQQVFKHLINKYGSVDLNLENNE
jgi:hypothetical protein